MSARSHTPWTKLVALVLGLTLLGAVVGGALAALRAQTYTSTAVVMVTPAEETPEGRLNDVSQFILNTMPTYHQLTTSSPVVDAAVGDGLERDDVISGLESEVPNGTTLIQLDYTDSDEARSADVANTLAGSLEDAVLQRSTGPDGTAQVQVTTVQDAASATVTNDPSILRWAAVGAVVGALVSWAVIRIMKPSAGSGRRGAARGATANGDVQVS